MDIHEIRRRFGLNERQAKFALAKGMGATNREAHKEAGYKVKDDNSMDANSSALVRNRKVKAAIDHVFAQHTQELREELHIDKTKVISDLEVVKLQATKNKQFGPLIRAIELQGKAAGVSFTPGPHPTPADSLTDEQLVDALAQGDSVLAEALRKRLGEWE